LLYFVGGVEDGEQGGFVFHYIIINYSLSVLSVCLELLSFYY
jgi:hypothetical protein